MLQFWDTRHQRSTRALVLGPRGGLYTGSILGGFQCHPECSAAGASPALWAVGL
jgi:hypothetical protein